MFVTVFLKNAMLYCAKNLWSCPTLCDPMDYSLPGSSVHGILQARVLEWVVTFFSRGSSQPGIKLASLWLLHWKACSLPLVPPGMCLKNATSNQFVFHIVFLYLLII